MNPHDSRRQFLQRAGLAGIALAAPGLALPLSAQQPETGEEEVSPAEDLMREHGVLNRILLIYDEINRRLSARADFDPAIVSGAAGIIQRFIEDYHEKLEEDYLFPRFEKAGRLTDLVAVLREQHRAGRGVTARILQVATPASLRDSGNRAELGRALAAFVRMYRPHEAREDTVLFPALREIVSSSEYASLGEEFEDKEHELFGEEGFEKVVDQVAGLERSLGIYDLAQFTPR